MPQSPATPQSRRPSNNKQVSESTSTNEKSGGSRAASGKAQNVIKDIDIGPQTGNFDTASVRHKIRKWQIQGGGVVPADEKTQFDEDAPELKPTESTALTEPAPSTPKSPSKSAPSPKIRSAGTPKGRKVTHNDLSEDIKTASAPRKRVISDGHWVRHKSSSRIETVPGPSSKQASPNSKRYVDNVRDKSPKNQISLSSPGASAKRLAPKSAPDDKAIRVEHTSPVGGRDRRKTRSAEHRRRRGSHGNKSRSSSQATASSNSTSTPPKGHNAARTGETRVSKKSSHDDGLDRLETPTSRKSAHRLHESPGDSDGKGTTLKKRRLPDKLERASPQQKEGPSPPVFSNRIEAWLTDTPDPFVDDKEASPRHSIAGGSGRSRRSSRTQTETDEAKKPDSSKRSQHSFAHGETADYEKSRSPKNDSDESPAQTALKRSGAKRNVQSPTRERRKDGIRVQPLPEDDVLTVAPSSVDPSGEDCWEDLPVKQSPMSRRRFPTTGKRLSTIASVETFHTRRHHVAPPSVSEASENTAKPQKEEIVAPSEDGDTFDPNSLTGVKGRGTSLKRKLTTHADLMSVLSLPNAGNKSIISARSIRTNRSRLASATISDLMKELETDEMKYTRELKTLVDGVIPVLLTCVLSKSDSALAAGLFSRAGSPNDPDITKPIVDMGIALERLKSTHRRIPKSDPDIFLSWAEGAQRIYADYLKAWRLGFQDVVVNLAPAVEEGSKAPPATTESAGWDEGLPRNEEGYVINGDGERVDVAFLLKRPLVRLKYLAKTLKVCTPRSQCKHHTFNMFRASISLSHLHVLRLWLQNIKILSSRLANGPTKNEPG